MSIWSRLGDRAHWWPDLILVLAAFTSYYFSDRQARIILVLLGFFKDMLFGSVLGPTAFVAIVMHWMSSLALDFEDRRSWYRGLLFTAGWIFLAQALQIGLFRLLPGTSRIDSAFSTQVIGLLSLYLRTLLPSLLASLAYLGLFTWLYPDFKQIDLDDGLEIADSPSRLL
ncbi:MAG: hypothetical protein PUG36_06665 [Clostridiales bacterium]|nr:hypothetical protein [Clostridiales bacterium]